MQVEQQSLVIPMYRDISQSFRITLFLQVRISFAASLYMPISVRNSRLEKVSNLTLIASFVASILERVLCATNPSSGSAKKHLVMTRRTHLLKVVSLNLLFLARSP